MQGANLVSRLLERLKQINYWLLILPMIALVGMFFLDAVNVTTIRLFGVRATPAQKELIEEQLILVIYVGLAYVLLGPGHIKTEMVKDLFGPRLRFIATMISDTAMLSLAAFTTSAITAGAITSFTHGATKMGEIQVPLGPFHMMIAVSFAMLTLVALLVMIHHILCFREGQHKQLSKQDSG